MRYTARYVNVGGIERWGEPVPWSRNHMDRPYWAALISDDDYHEMLKIQDRGWRNHLAWCNTWLVPVAEQQS